MSDRSEPVRPKTRASKACTACRQVKLRCDVSSNFPGPCTRCKSSGRVCRVDSSFKRTSTRRQLEQVTSQLADLKHRIETPSQTLSASSGPTAQDPTSVLSSTIDSEPASEDFFGLKTVRIEDVNAARLGNVEVTPRQVYDLFSFFSKHQYEHLPALDPRISVDSIQRNSPFLFWTIAMTASRYHQTHYQLASSLEEAYHEMLAKYLIRAPMSLPSIQAILLLCYWPFPCTKQIFDPSWNYYGMALNAARLLALDAPMEKLSFKISHEDYRLRTKVWLSCFHVGTMLALRWGITLPISSTSDLQHVKHLTSTSTAPNIFLTQLMFHHEVAQFRLLLPSNRGYESTLSAMRLFEASIDMTARSPAVQLNAASEICQLRAKISLYTTVLMLAQSGTDRSQPTNYNIDIATVSVTISGLHAASRLVYIFATWCEEAATDTGYTLDAKTQDNQPTSQLCIAKQYLEAGSTAVLFLIRFCVFNDRINNEDKKMAEDMVKVSYQLFNRISKRSNDEAARTVAVLKVICNAGSWDMMITDRECASIWFDACRRAGDLRGRKAKEKFPDALATEVQSENHGDSPVAGASAVNAPSVPSLDDTDMWLSLLDFPDMDWPSADHDVFTSMAPP